MPEPNRQRERFPLDGYRQNEFRPAEASALSLALPRRATKTTAFLSTCGEVLCSTTPPTPPRESLLQLIL